MHQLACGEVWGGISNHEDDVQSAGLVASLYSSAADGSEGGDLYYVSQCESGLLTRIAVADVVGHGAVVSDMSQWVYDSLRRRMNMHESDVVLHDVNALACDKGIGAMTTAIVAAYFKPDARLTFVSAGHPLPLVWLKQRGTWSPAETPANDADSPSNLPLGVLPDVPYVQSTYDLTQGDRVFLYTDGLAEAPNADKEQLGSQAILNMLNALGDVPLADIKSAILTTIRDHTGGSLKHDDVTFLLVEIT